MKPEKINNYVRIQHAIDAILFIRKVADDVTFDDFKNDTRGYYACLYQFTILGETINRVDMDLLRQFDYPWHKVRAFRNFILHEYHLIDEKMVWDTIIAVLPQLQRILEEILASSDN
jgi:uncharacterized protein with HEPN domain